MAFTKTKVWSVLPQTGEVPVISSASGEPAYVPTSTRVSQPRPSVPLPAEPAEPRATRMHRQVGEHAHVRTAQDAHTAEHRHAQVATRIAPLADLLAPEPPPSALPVLPPRAWTREILLAGAAFAIAGSATVALSMRSAEAHKPPQPPTLERAVAAALAAGPQSGVVASSEQRPALAKNAERAAVDALASGDRAEAARRYGALAMRYPERREFAEAARILAR